MLQFLITVLLLSTQFFQTLYAKEVRTIYLSEKSIETIFLSQGHSTALKFDKFPRPAIIGNKKDFLVETFQKVVAIKPLKLKARTNLFIFTSEGNFNFKLVSGSKTPDTFVLVKRKKLPEKQSFKNSKLKVYKKPLSLVVHKVLFPKSKTISSIYFSILLNPSSKRKYLVNDFIFTVFQNRNKLPIKKIFIDRPILLAKNNKISGYLILNSKQLVRKKALVLKLSGKFIRKPLYLKIPFL